MIKQSIWRQKLLAVYTYTLNKFLLKCIVQSIGYANSERFLGSVSELKYVRQNIT